MTLTIAEDSPTEAYVWCDEVPTDFSDADVEYNVKAWATAGDAVAIRALALVGYWCRMGFMRLPTTRCYRDGAL